MIFLTGGTGLLGLHILDELRHRAMAVTALVRDDRGAALVAARGAVPMQGTVESAATWDGVGDCRAIIHSAAIIAGPPQWERFHQVNIEGTRLAAGRALALGIPLLHISSVAVYGRAYGPGAVVDEDTPFMPLGPAEFYARSKRRAEEIVWEYALRGLNATTFRPCVVYGPGDRLFLPGLVANMTRAPRVPLIGGGDRPLALVHAANVAKAVVLALGNSRARGQAFNLTNDDEITARQFVAAVGRGLGRELRTINIPDTLAQGLARGADQVRRLLGPSRYPGSALSAVRFWRGGNPYTSKKARLVLGWDPAVRHERGVEEAVKWEGGTESG